MNSRCVVLVLVIALACASAATAERPPQKRGEAHLVVVGKVEKISTTTEPFAGDGEMTHYTAKVAVAKVTSAIAEVKGAKDVKAGDTIEVKWFHVTKRSTRKLVVGAFGHGYDLKEKDEATFWLMKQSGAWTVIYNKDGVEKVTK